MIRVKFINNLGTGFASEFEIQEGTVLAQFVSEQVGENPAYDYAISVNRGPEVAEYVLRDGDKIAVTPRKMDAAIL